MKIKLISAPMTNDTNKNLDTLKNYIKNSDGMDLLVFGESFLQGFNGLTWDYEKDKDIAISIDNHKIRSLRSLSSEKNIAISFGFFERFENNIYSSNLIIDKNGKVLDIYRRVSKTWTIKNTTQEYRSGNEFKTVDFMGTKLLVAICGDLWFEKNIETMNKLNPDFILWPLYIDYTEDEWFNGACEEYKEQVSKLKAPVLMVNSYMKDGAEAVGGAYLFSKGEIKNTLPLGSIGEIIIHFNEKRRRIK